MAIAELKNLVRFIANAAGTGNFVVGASIAGFALPEGAYAIDGKAYEYVAKSPDNSQFEYGKGVYTYATDTLARTTIYSTSDRTQSAVDFLVAPIVDVLPAPQPYLETPPPLPKRGYIWGLQLSTAGSSTTFAVTAGECADSTGAASIILAAFTKTTAAWAAGTGNGALANGSIAASTWYHVHAITKLVAGGTAVSDILISTSPTAPTLPTDYTLFRRIGSMLTNGSSQWTKFIQNGDEFMWDTPVLNLNSAAGVTTASLNTLTTPLGIITQAILFAEYAHPSAAALLIYDPAKSAQTANSPLSNASVVASQAGSIFDSSPVRVFTNTSSQVRIGTSIAGGQIFCSTHGWVDRRGQLQ